MATKFLEVPLVEPSYLTLTDYERNFPLTYWRNVFGDYWQISAYASVVYVTLVFGTKFYMRNRAPFKLNGLLTAWNIGLAIMSIYAFLRVAPEFFRVLLGTNGFHNSICEWWVIIKRTTRTTYFFTRAAKRAHIVPVEFLYTMSLDHVSIITSCVLCAPSSPSCHGNNENKSECYSQKIIVSSFFMSFVVFQYFSSESWPFPPTPSKKMYEQKALLFCSRKKILYLF